MEEIFDRVDENDNIIGKTTKKEAHEKGYAHRVTSIFVFAPDGKLLVQRRRDNKKLDHSAAGHVDKGESYDVAARRELEEELGLGSKIKRLGTFYADERFRPGNQVMHYFGLFETYPREGQIKQIKLQEDEVLELIPMRIKDVARRMEQKPLEFATGFFFTLNFYIKHKGLNIPLIKIQ